IADEWRCIRMEVRNENFSETNPVDLEPTIDNLDHDVARRNMIVARKFAARRPDQTDLRRGIISPNGDREIGKRLSKLRLDLCAKRDPHLGFCLLQKIKTK